MALQSVTRDELNKLISLTVDQIKSCLHAGYVSRTSATSTKGDLLKAVLTDRATINSALSLSTAVEKIGVSVGRVCGHPKKTDGKPCQQANWLNPIDRKCSHHTAGATAVASGTPTSGPVTRSQTATASSSVSHLSRLGAAGTAHEVPVVATLNISQGFTKKLIPMLKWAKDHNIGVLALQEIGMSRVCPSGHAALADYGYRLVTSTKRAAGAALLIKIIPSDNEVTRTFVSETGRLVGALCTSVLYISAYLPTNLDRAKEESPEAKEAIQIYEELQSWTTEVASLGVSGGVTIHPTVVVMGDLNETMAIQDRNLGKGAKHNRFISRLPANGFSDAYRTVYPLNTGSAAGVRGMQSPGWTCKTELKRDRSVIAEVVKRYAESRIDYVWSKGIEAQSATVMEAPSGVNTNHRAVVVSWRGASRTSSEQLPYFTMLYSPPQLGA
jgi:exonuclease III